MFMKGQDKDVLKLDLFKNVASIAWLYMIGTGAVGKIPLGDAKLANWTIVPITVSSVSSSFLIFYLCQWHLHSHMTLLNLTS